jgi:hypothetical protein
MRFASPHEYSYTGIITKKPPALVKESAGGVPKIQLQIELLEIELLGEQLFEEAIVGLRGGIG